MRKIYFFTLFLIIQFSSAQSDTLYLFIEKPFFQYQTIKDIGIGFTLKSEDNRFVCDYYKFGIINYQGWDEKGDDVYLSLKELRKEIDINTISYKTIKDLSLDKTWWEIHNELSLYKKYSW